MESSMLGKNKPFKTSFYNPYHTKKRTRTTPEQLEALETIFQCSPKPAMQVRKELSLKLSMPLRNIQVWFQNRRAKAKSTNCLPQETGNAECAVRNMKHLTLDNEPATSIVHTDLPVWANQDQVYSPLDEYFSTIFIPSQFDFSTQPDMSFMYPFPDPYLPYYSNPCMPMFPHLE